MFIIYNGIDRLIYAEMKISEVLTLRSLTGLKFWTLPHPTAHQRLIR